MKSILKYNKLSLLIENDEIDISELLPMIPLIEEMDDEIRKSMRDFEYSPRYHDLVKILEPIKEKYGIASSPFLMRDAELWCLDKKLKYQILELS